MREKIRLSEFLENNHEARKIFGKRELDIIKRQLLGIKLTQSEKNRLSQDIRKKLRFIEKVARFEDEFNLKKGSEIKIIVKKVVDNILHDKLKDRIKRIFLFGSSITNERTFRSDIDIGVEFKNKISLKEATEFRIRTLSEFDEKIDIQVYNILPDKIKNSIEKNHKILYKNG